MQTPASLVKRAGDLAFEVMQERHLICYLTSPVSMGKEK